MTVVRSVFSYNPAGWRPVGALLRVLGVALAAYGGSHFGGNGAAVLAAIGALYAGIASFGGVHKARLRRMLAATAAASLTALLGSLIQPNDAATIVGVTLGTFVLAIVAEAGPDAAQVCLLATGLLVVFSGVPHASDAPFGNAALVLGGGLAQAAILMVFHPISPLAAERRAVEAVYAGLARFATARARGAQAPLPNVALNATARDLLRASFGYGGGAEQARLWSELELADALRGNLAGLDRASTTRGAWSTLGRWLAEATEAVGRGRPIERTLPEFEPAPSADPWVRRIRRTVEAQEAGKLPTATPSPGAWMRALVRVPGLRELALGHALRYATATGLATAAYRLPAIDHGYWAPLALVFSLKPDFAGTVTKGVGRIVGTLLGVFAATLLVSLAHPSSAGLALALLGATWTAFALLNAWFVGYSTALAFWVVVAVTLAGASVRTVGIERVELTAAGSLLALATALVWPQWEAGKARTALAVAFAAQAAYAEAVLAFESVDAAMAARLQSRAARLEAERIVAAAGFEPAWSRGQSLEGADAALARLAENAARILAAHVAALDPQGTGEMEELRRLVDEDRGMAADLMG